MTALELQNEVTAIQPYLSVLKVTEGFLVRGKFMIVLEGEVVDEYAVEISIPNDFPHKMPTIWETGCRIPRVAERHIGIIETNGAACVMTPENYYVWQSENNASFCNFLRGPVTHFFIGQSLKERGLTWPVGERAHGVIGLLQWYEETLGLHDHQAIIWCVHFLCQKSVKGHLSCPCKSGRIVRKCHARLLLLHRQIPRATFLYTLNQWKQHLIWQDAISSSARRVAYVSVTRPPTPVDREPRNAKQANIKDLRL